MEKEVGLIVTFPFARKTKQFRLVARVCVCVCVNDMKWGPAAWLHVSRTVGHLPTTQNSTQRKPVNRVSLWEVDTATRLPSIPPGPSVAAQLWKLSRFIDPFRHSCLSFSLCLPSRTSTTASTQPGVPTAWIQQQDDFFLLGTLIYSPVAPLFGGRDFYLFHCTALDNDVDLVWASSNSWRRYPHDLSLFETETQYYFCHTGWQRRGELLPDGNIRHSIRISHFVVYKSKMLNVVI